MRKRLFLFAVALCLALALAMPAWADTGPKPSVVITVEGVQEQCAATLLADQKGNGPWSAESTYSDWYGPEQIWQAFRDYPAQGFYFWGPFAEDVREEPLRWTYYPPQTFKVLLYFPADGSYAVSEVQQRYAFDSYYTVTVRDRAIVGVRHSYDYTWELLSLLVRMTLTVAVELGLAWVFRLRGRYARRVILLANLATQLALNVALNWVNYQMGQFAFVRWYLLLEIAVFVAEGIVYRALLRGGGHGLPQRTRPWLYAFSANLASLAVGLAVSVYFPGIF